MSKIVINQLGRAVARSGLLPTTAHYFLEYLRTHTSELKNLLATQRMRLADSDFRAATEAEVSDSTFVFAHLCFTSPEFGGGEGKARRSIPYQLAQRRESARATKLDSMLAVRPWDRDVLAVNAADLTVDWVSGVPIIELEKRFERLRAGTLRDMYRTLVEHMTAFADVVSGMLAASDAGELPSEYSWVANERALLFRIVRRARQIARCTVRGIPEELLWLAELEDVRHRPLCRRPELISFYRRNLRTLESVIDPGRKTDLIEALRDVLSDAERWKVIRTGALEYRRERTERRRSSHLRRLPKECEGFIREYYESRGTAFETALQRCFDTLGIKVTARDDGSTRGKSFPDFIVEYGGRAVIIECKSSEGTNDISLSEATDVFRKAGIQNLNHEPLVTVCQPYVASDVPRKIETSDRLSVVNSEDFAEALVRLYLRRLDPIGFLNWLTTPGQPRCEELSSGS